MKIPMKIEIWTDLRIIVSNYSYDDVGQDFFNDVGVTIRSVDYDVTDPEKEGDLIFIEKERIPDLIQVLQKFVSNNG